MLPRRDLVLQLEFFCEDEVLVLTCSGLTGEELLRLNASGSDLAWNTHKHIARELNLCLQDLRLVLPNGELLASVCRANPVVTLADVSETRKRRRLT